MDERHAEEQLRDDSRDFRFQVKKVPTRRDVRERQKASRWFSDGRRPQYGCGLMGDLGLLFDSPSTCLHLVTNKCGMEVSCRYVRSCQVTVGGEIADTARHTSNERTHSKRTTIDRRIDSRPIDVKHNTKKHRVATAHRATAGRSRLDSIAMASASAAAPSMITPPSEAATLPPSPSASSDSPPILVVLAWLLGIWQSLLRGAWLAVRGLVLALKNSEVRLV